MSFAAACRSAPASSWSWRSPSGNEGTDMPKSAPAPPSPRRFSLAPLRSLRPLGVLVLVVGLFLSALILLHRFTRQEIQAQGRDEVAFADIDCTPPLGASRAEFL